jgi:hypothetical protein
LAPLSLISEFFKFNIILPVQDPVKARQTLMEQQDVSTKHEDGETSIPCPLSTTEKALVRKIDWRLIPMLFIIYIAAFLDR